ncbi:hypothetical protein AV530_006239 [Patagioenas fasciata monilis]|uniref:Uncharacterized protein n=1 Tax=Patagioenas fasciata monilis TaxID=372326 RepID=A0A1V4KG18_PATFA|nr:hypothetical protein AV530_006239 [Patagioenas fasciata monilis]
MCKWQARSLVEILILVPVKDDDKAVNDDMGTGWGQGVTEAAARSLTGLQSEGSCNSHTVYPSQEQKRHKTNVTRISFLRFS